MIVPGVQTYDFKGQVRDLTERISDIIKGEPTLLGLIGISQEKLKQPRYEWMSDNLNSNRAMLGQDESHHHPVDYNYTQIIERKAWRNNTEQACNHFTVSIELDYQVQLRLKEMARELNDWLIYGRRVEGRKSVQPSTTGGLLYFAEQKKAVTQNVNGGELSAKLLNDTMEKVYQRGGSVNTILTNTAGARQMSKLAADSVGTGFALEHQVSTFVSDIMESSDVKVVVDLNMPKDTVVLFDRSILSLHAWCTIHDEDAGGNGADFVARQIRGKLGIKVKNAYEKIAVLENISTSVS